MADTNDRGLERQKSRAATTGRNARDTRLGAIEGISRRQNHRYPLVDCVNRPIRHYLRRLTKCTSRGNFHRSGFYVGSHIPFGLWADAGSNGSSRLLGLFDNASFPPGCTTLPFSLSLVPPSTRIRLDGGKAQVEANFSGRDRPNRSFTLVCQEF